MMDTGLTDMHHPLAYVCLVSALFKIATSEAILYVQFNEFHSNHNCDPFSGSCDPAFDICVTGSKENCRHSGKHQDHNNLIFTSKVGQLSNPMTFRLDDRWPGYATLNVRVTDIDTHNDDHMADFDGNIYASPDGSWHSRTRQDGPMVLIFRYRVVCSPEYYGSDCTHHCIPTNFYSCDRNTGNRVCHSNYYGSACNVYCSPTISYTCHSSTGKKMCNTGYYGPDCSTHCPASNTYTCDSNTGDKICNSDYYGKECSAFCKASNTYTCDLSTGGKICKPDYYGSDCARYCPASDTYSCSQFTGNKICNSDYYGSECAVHCPASSNYDCDGDTGEKTCRPDYYGLDCGVHCDKPTVFDTYTCDPKTGRKIYGGAPVGVKGVDTYCPSQLPRDGHLHVSGHTCYQFVLDHVTDYPNARGRCEAMGGMVALVKDQATNDFLVPLLQSYHPSKTTFWIGLRDISKDHDYTWEDETKLSAGNFNNWARGQGPLGGSTSHFTEDCVAMDILDRGSWHDYECDDKTDPFHPSYFPYVCQYVVTPGNSTANVLIG